jgi:NOL1/NOP2/fmu family ribosome biogenesis protein
VEEDHAGQDGVLPLSAGQPAEKPKSGNGSAACSFTDAFDKKKENRKKKKKAGAGKTPQDSGLTQMMQLWREFREEALVPSPLFSGEKNLLLFGESLYALPFPADTMSFAGMRVLRPGLQLGTAVKGRFVPAHSLGMALGREEVRRAVDLPGDSPAAYAWFRGESIPLPPDSENGWTLVLIDGCAAGWGKAVGTMLKNHYPKGLRRNMQP